MVYAVLNISALRRRRSVVAALPDRRAGSPEISNSIWGPALVVLFVAALLFRLQNLDMSPYGDEAYYYFITHDLGAWWNTAAYPVSGSTFPVFPLVYHLFAGNLLSLRAANAVVGSSLVPLGILIMRELGIRRALAIVAGAFLALDTILVQFSGLAFLDMLGALIALTAVLAYLRGRLALAAVLVAFAVMEKEYYAILGIALAADQLLARRRIYVELLLAAIPVLAWLALRYAVLGASLVYLISGHAHAELTIGGVDHAIGSIALLPLGIASAVLSPKLRAAAIYIVLFLSFQAVWGNAQGWYWCLSVALATILAAHGAALLLESRDHAVLRAAAVGALAVAAFSVQAWTTERYLQTWHGGDLSKVAAYLDGQPAQPVDLVDCEWPYRYYPLGGPNRPATSTDQWDVATARLAVACPGAPPAPTDWAVRYRSGTYTVLGR